MPFYSYLFIIIETHAHLRLVLLQSLLFALSWPRFPQSLYSSPLDFVVAFSVPHECDQSNELHTHMITPLSDEAALRL